MKPGMKIIPLFIFMPLSISTWHTYALLMQEEHWCHENFVIIVSSEDCAFQVYFYLFIQISEFFIIRDDIQKEIQNLKRELQSNKKKKEEEKEEKAERKNEVAKNETVDAYKQEQEKYKQLKSQMPVEGNGKLFTLSYVNVVRMKGLTQCKEVFY